MERIEKLFINSEAFSEKGEAELIPKIEKINRTSPLIIYISNRGGDLYSMFSIMDTIKLFSKKTIGVTIGNCYSAAVDLFLSCDIRLCTPNSLFMIHETSLSFEGFELTSKINEEIKIQQKIENERIKMILKRTLIDKETLGEYFSKKQDMYFSSQEALSWGIVEGIVKTEKDILKYIK